MTKQDTQRDSKPVPDQVTVRGDADALKEFAGALAGKPVREGVRAYVIPADAEAYSEALDSGAIGALHDAGFSICDPAMPEPALAPGEFELSVPGAELTEVVEAIRAG
jgi:hypothetical protein